MKVNITPLIYFIIFIVNISQAQFTNNIDLNSLNNTVINPSVSISPINNLKENMFTTWQASVTVRDLGGPVVENALVYLWDNSGCTGEKNNNFRDVGCPGTILCDGDPISSGTTNSNGVYDFTIQTNSNCFCAYAIGGDQWCGWTCNQCQMEPGKYKLEFDVVLIPYKK